MSQIIAPMGTSSILELLKYGDTITVLPTTTMWWRQRLFPREDGTFFTTEIDDPENPTQVTVTWRDAYGPDDDVLDPYATRISSKEPEMPAFLGDWTPHYVGMTRTDYYLDVLWHAAPTAGRWEPLTSYGQHVHPDDRDYINELQRKFIEKMIGAQK